ncbi:MAG: mechanosensitive ion channel [Anaerolineales bacterium]|nr:mechanosensitive ion channel [Anaerolineales bacterium]
MGVAYGSDVDKTKEVIVEAVRSNPGVQINHPIEGLFMEFADSSLSFKVCWWIESYEETCRLTDAVNTAIYKGLNEARIEIPFHQQDIHHKYSPELQEEILKIIIKRG